MAPTESVDLDAIFSSDTEDEAAGEAKERKRIEEATTLKEEGSAILKEGRVVDALATYKRSLSSIWALYRCKKSAQAVAVGVAVDLNMALCHLRLEDWESGKRSAARALENEPGNPKGLYRRGIAQARLGLLEGAEDDLAAAFAAQPSADTKKELLEVKKRRGGSERKPTVSKGFLAGATSKESMGADGSGRATAAESEVKEEEIEEHGEDSWYAGKDVHKALQEVNTYLSAVAEGCSGIVCATAAEKRALIEQIRLAERLLPMACKAVEGAEVEGSADVVQLPAYLDAGGGSVDVEDVLERMASGMEYFRPYLTSLERKSGEFDSVRLVRELRELDAGGKKVLSTARCFDLELVRWGDAKPASPDNFAEPLFPPSGKPPTEEAATWQWEAFHRIFQKDASKFVAGAAWLVLRHLLKLGVSLHLQGQRLVEVGIATGCFFALPVADGPLPPTGQLKQGVVEPIPDRCRADSLAICSSADKRLIMLPSFSSLGTAHKWLLLRTEADSDATGYPAAAASSSTAWSADMCCGALGLLQHRPKLVRIWKESDDDRYLLRSCGWGENAAAMLVQAATSHSGAEWQKVALAALLRGAQLPMRLLEVLLEDTSLPKTAQADFCEDAAAASRQEMGRRLLTAIHRLGLKSSREEGCGAIASLEGAVAEGNATEPVMDTARKFAANALTRRKLEAAGLGPIADKLQL
eukprot:TRINITY_DN45261_c0_g1_i1.p1 TRINITY_DN45261_c0_g1~~TRINITY_DN45261_c0_g1_i1.p1  ORF type:complete len:698 (+),score=181.44 TRINITY_DN45261_c0_g1_i1:439-2532(+)